MDLLIEKMVKWKRPKENILIVELKVVACLSSTNLLFVSYKTMKPIRIYMM